MPLDPNAPKGPPPHWGDDELTSFMQLAASAGWGAFCTENTRGLFERLRDIDATFLRVVNALNRPTGNLVEALMLLSGHASFRAAAQFAMEGRSCEAMVLLRSSLEYALYAVHIFRNPELAAVWAKRGDGDDERRAVRNSFKPGEMMAALTVFDPQVGNRFKRFYEITIDMGAHPNEIGFFGRIEMQTKLDGTKLMVMKYLSGGDANHVSAMMTACRVGVIVLETFRLIYRERFDEQQITQQIGQLKLGL